MQTKIVIAMLVGVALGAAMTITFGPLPQREVPKVEPADKSQIAKTATEWFKSHYQNIELHSPVIQDDGLVISGTVAYRDGMFSSYGLEVVVSPSSERLVVRGMCPVKIRKERIAAMREFAVRADFKMHESIATLYLDAEGSLHCRASMPFDALLIDVEEAMWMLAASIESKLLSCEGAAKRVCDEVCSPTEAVGDIQEFQLLTEDYLHKSSCECEPSRFASYEGLPPVEDVVKQWFDKEESYYEMHRDPCTTQFTGFWRYMGDDYFESVSYRVDIANRTLICMCRCPLSLQGDGGHDDIVGLVSDFNARHDKASLKMDLDAGRLTTQYEMPVSLLRRPRSQSRFRTVAADMTSVPNKALVESCEKLKWILSAK